MYEHESDILVAEPEQDVAETENMQAENTQPSSVQNQQPQADDLVEVFYKPQKVQQNKTVKKQTQTFTNYNNSHLNKVYKKYDVVQTYVPQSQAKPAENKEFEKFVNQQDSYSATQESFVTSTPAQKPTFRLKQKAKVWLVCFSVIIVMLSALCITNAVNISNLNSNIEQTQSSITNVNKNIQNTIKDIGKLTDEQEIKNNASDLGLTEVEPENNIEIQLNQKNEVEDYQRQTNFFDEICNFIRSLFGG